MKLCIIGYVSGGRTEAETSGDNPTICVETRFPEQGDIDLKGYVIKRMYLNHDSDTLRVFVEKERE